MTDDTIRELRPQWEDCKVCGGDHWTKDHPIEGLEAQQVSVSPEVLAIAEAQAAKDRDMLARLVREGKAMSVSNKRGYGKSFVADIQERAFPTRKINLAIRPKRKKGRR